MKFIIIVVTLSVWMHSMTTQEESLDSLGKNIKLHNSDALNRGKFRFPFSFSKDMIAAPKQVLSVTFMFEGMGCL